MPPPGGEYPSSSGSPTLHLGTREVVRGVEVADRHAGRPGDPDGLDQPPLEPALADPLVPEIGRRVLRRDENRVRLPRQTGAEEPLV